MENRICSKCKIEKPISEYAKNATKKLGINSSCKKCVKEYKIRNKKNIREYMDKWHKENYNNQKKYRNENKERLKIAKTQYYKNNTLYFKNYREVNKAKSSLYSKIYRSNKRNSDYMFKLKDNIRTRIGMAIKAKNFAKNYRTNEYLGISYAKYKVYLERKFEKGMTWENYGQWHIDHIIPLASATNEEELKLLFHYTNTQPLWADENFSKGYKMPSNVQIKLPL